MTSGDIYREVGQRIRRFRKSAGRTQQQLAVEIGVSRASIANIEAGRQNFLLHHIYGIATALDLESPVSLLPGPHEDIAVFFSDAAVPVQQDGLTKKQRQEVIRLMSSEDENRGGRPFGGETR